MRPAVFSVNKGENKVFQRNANDLIKEISGDILYLDPPYNHREYGANYHILNTIAEYNPFDPQGISGLPQYNKSDYCKKKSAAKSLRDLIHNADFKWIFLSYNNEGIIGLEEIQDIMSEYGDYEMETMNYSRFKSDKEENRVYKADATTEYLHILRKK